MVPRNVGNRCRCLELDIFFILFVSLLQDLFDQHVVASILVIYITYDYIHIVLLNKLTHFLDCLLEYLGLPYPSSRHPHISPNIVMTRTTFFFQRPKGSTLLPQRMISISNMAATFGRLMGLKVRKFNLKKLENNSQMKITYLH